MSRVFFTADAHFGHGNIIKYCHRPFLSQQDQEVLNRSFGIWHDGDWKGPNPNQDYRISQEGVDKMDDALIDNINSTVGEDDTLWHLGDFCFGSKSTLRRKAELYRSRIRCRDVRLVWGNHDNRKVIQDFFTETYDLTETSVEGQKIVLCHYAMAVWDKSHRGSWQLYGHSHSEAEPWMDANMPGRRSFDVGVDNIVKLFGAYRPISFEEVKAIMSRRHGFSMDHHVLRNSKAPTEEDLAG